MSGTSDLGLSLASLFAEREARRRQEREAEEQLKQREREELAAFKKRLEDFQLDEDKVRVVLDRIRRAFDRGETELQLTSFPSTFCSDSGRAIINADLPPINRPKEPQADAEPAWIATLPAGGRVVYDYWKTNLKPGGFQFSARILNYKEGRPGDIGLFFSWPKNAPDA
ncbi:MAG: hypothetical protein J0H14_04670 [Alphaproteobacteria bacterium]|nr:hypothetical protein [Alphaproteobacteria bacterium]